MAALVRDRKLSRRMAPLQYEPAWRPKGRMTMSEDMPLSLLDMVSPVLGAEMRSEWDEECLNLEVRNFDIWKQACALWKQAGWVSKRVALAANHRAEEKRVARYAPQPPQPPTMAMSLEQPLTVEANPNEAEVTEDDTAMPVTPSSSGEHAAELTPNVELTEPIGDLTIDTDVETVVPSPVRRASVSDASPLRAVSPRSRNKSAIQ